ncbi:hypothetical protein AaE_008058, partial [Aphanomyces astaci]
MTTEEVRLAMRVYRWAKRKKLRSAKTMLLFEFGLGIPVERPLIPDVRFNLDISDINAQMSFRFDVRGILELACLLGVPNVVTSGRDRVCGVEALCVLLRRLRYPVTFYDMVATFVRSREQLCRVFNHMVVLLYGQWKDVIYCNQKVVRLRIALYAHAAANKGAPLSYVWSFPEGMNLQKQIYSGHKRKHCLNFQGLTTPDGLCIHYYGPLEGSGHDVTLLRVSQLQEYFE